MASKRKKTTSFFGKNSENKGRYIPEEVRKQLRKEVAFGCPIKNCGSPYLSYHHFDPPYHVEKHHRPEGMIALCLHHHKAADNDAYTSSQLRSFKKYPYLKTVKQKPKGRFEWEREQLIVLMGGGAYTSNEVILRVKTKDIIWVSKSEYGYDNLNLDIYNEQGKPLFIMRDNDWLIHDYFSDLICPPCGNSINLKAKTKDVEINIKFYQSLKKELDKKLETISPQLSCQNKDFIKEFLKKDELALCQVNLNLVYPLPLTIDNFKVFNRLGGGSPGSVTCIGAKTALTIF
jgi:hypothetical protein